MTGFVAKHFVKMLKKKGFRVVRKNYDRHTGDWVVTGKGIFGVIAPHIKKYYNADFFIDNEEYWDKYTKAPIMVDISKVDVDELLDDISFLASQEGKEYNRTYAFLEDDKAKFKTMKYFSFPDEKD